MNTFVNIKFSDVDYVNNNDGHTEWVIIESIYF